MRLKGSMSPPSSSLQAPVSTCPLSLQSPVLCEVRLGARVPHVLLSPRWDMRPSGDPCLCVSPPSSQSLVRSETGWVLSSFSVVSVGCDARRGRVCVGMSPPLATSTWPSFRNCCESALQTADLKGGGSTPLVISWLGSLRVGSSTGTSQPLCPCHPVAAQKGPQMLECSASHS